MIKILFICHGNICRSTMAESVMTHLINQQNLSHLFEIASAATSREEIGNPPHYGTVGKLREVGIPVVPHRAVQMTKVDYDYYDYSNLDGYTYDETTHKLTHSLCVKHSTSLPTSLVAWY